MSIAERATWYMESEEACLLAEQAHSQIQMAEQLHRWEIAKRKEEYQLKQNQITQERLNRMVSSSSTVQTIPAWLKIINTTT